MKILMISDHADPLAQIGAKEAGGQNVYVYSLARYLVAAGHDVDVFTRWDDAGKAEVVQVQPRLRVIRVKAGPVGYMPRDNFVDVTDEFVQNTAKRLRQEKLQYDAMHTNYWFSGVIGLALRQEFGIPMYHVYHSVGPVRLKTLRSLNPEAVDETFFAGRIESERQIAREADGIIATSPVERGDIINLLGADPLKINVIPVGVDDYIFKPQPQAAARQKLGLDPHAKVIVYVGRIEERKGIGTLIEALGQLKQSHDNLQLLVVGGGTDASARKLDEAERSRLHKLARRCGVRRDITFIGGKTQDEIRDYYAAADVVSTPSYYEPFGIVPIEAMACGAPVVATKTGGFLYTIKHGETGYLATPRDFSDLADYLARVLAQGRSAFTAACLRQVRLNFLWSNVTAQMITYFKESASYENSLTRPVRRVRSS